MLGGRGKTIVIDEFMQNTIVVEFPEAHGFSEWLKVAAAGLSPSEY